MKLEGKLSAVSTLAGTISTVQGMSGSLSSNVFIKLQEKTVMPQGSVQRIVADDGYAGLSCVRIDAIPSNYGRIIYDGNLTIV